MVLGTHHDQGTRTAMIPPTGDADDDPPDEVGSAPDDETDRDDFYLSDVSDEELCALAQAEAPRLFAICEEDPDQGGTARVWCWGLEFPERAFFMTRSGSLIGRFRSAESAERRYSAAEDRRLVWPSPGA